MNWIDVKDKLPEEGKLVLTLDLRHPEFPKYRLDYMVFFESNKFFTYS